MKSTSCIRVFADTEHIQHCQTHLSHVEPVLQSLASLLALAGNEVRLKILFLLAQGQQLCVCDIADVLKMTVSAVSQHLRKLKDGGVLHAHKVGQTVFYVLSDRHLPILQPLLTGMSTTTTRQIAP
ncbi:winged helix-turn-helix transcriptional regulator [Hymenobacter sp. BT186]|uniref:Winged helix-turn-helix transcriptional regulator n=1 Tax=Hymenobacter telluris TaxID=2816474 RepID=A0A939EVC0_9BACT|nr:metalloregulator ArsR/SmtB family transcription factor [Hymenobacter telluris]MBO0357901.1 winged helix-turn-helix transcriptional regulator [Hymenobacter telluris]MBW3373928.1 metalloregulator ArsR/SmtB family transcription factor [Hymenobacter norwichensis]